MLFQRVIILKVFLLSNVYVKKLVFTYKQLSSIMSIKYKIEISIKKKRNQRVDNCGMEKDIMER